MSLKIAKINLNNLEITGYKNDKGDWYISESELAKLINVPQQTTNDFFNSKWLKSFLGKDYTTTEKIAKPGGGYIKKLLMKADEVVMSNFNELIFFSLPEDKSLKKLIIKKKRGLKPLFFHIALCYN